jgi:hypothetical protein
MRPSLERQVVDFLAGEGRNASEIARRTGIPRTTVRDWLRLPIIAGPTRLAADVPEPPAAEYAYLLGMYLGDGCISRDRRCHRLRIATDAAYPGITAECARAMQAVVPRNHVAVRRRTDGSRTVDVSAYSKSWPSLFPQHGAGRKHERRIALAEWQQRIVDDEPEMFLRGLIHSDGCRVLNRVNGRAYPRYLFSQRSADIREIFAGTCRGLGVTVSAAGRNQLSIGRRMDVAFVDGFVGAKA